MIYKHIINPFSSTRMSDPDYDKFTRSHIECVKTKSFTGSLYGKPITEIVNEFVSDTEVKLTAFKAEYDLRISTKAKREGKTITVDDTIDDMQDFISRKHGVIADIFPKGSAIYEEIFPLGLTEYRNANKTNAETLFKRFTNLIEAHQNELGAAMITEAKSKYNTYVSLRSGHLQEKSKESDVLSSVDNKRKELGIQLFENLTTLLRIHSSEPEKVLEYYDESLLKRRVKNHEEEETPSPVPTEK